MRARTCKGGAGGGVGGRGEEGRGEDGKEGEGGGGRVRGRGREGEGEREGEGGKAGGRHREIETESERPRERERDGVKSIRACTCPAPAPPAAFVRARASHRLAGGSSRCRALVEVRDMSRLTRRARPSMCSVPRVLVLMVLIGLYWRGASRCTAVGWRERAFPS